MEKFVLNSSTFLVLENNKIAAIVRTDDPNVWRAINPYTGEENEIGYEEASNYYKELVDSYGVRYKTPEGNIESYTDEQIQDAIDHVLLGTETRVPKGLINRLEKIEDLAIAPGGHESFPEEQLAHMRQEQEELKKKQPNKREEALKRNLEQFMHPSDETTEADKRKEQIQQERIQHKIFLRMKDLIPAFAKSVSNYEKQKNVKLTDSQIRSALKSMLNKNEIGLTGSDEVKENLLNEAQRLFEEQTTKSLAARRELKTFVDDLIIKIRSYEQRKNVKIPFSQSYDVLKRKLEESSMGAELTEAERKELFNAALNYFKNKSKLDAERMAGVFTIEELIKLGASEKVAMGLVEMAPGEQKQILDETTSESLNVQKTVAPNTGEELYVVEDAEGKKALKPEDPKIQELNQSGLVVEAFTTEQKTILSKLGFTI